MITRRKSAFCLNRWFFHKFTDSFKRRIISAIPESHALSGFFVTGMIGGTSIKTHFSGFLFKKLKPLNFKTSIKFFLIYK